MNKLNELRKVMAENHIDIYYIPSTDFHSSEYVVSFFKAREYISNFTGSAGELVISQNHAVLYTDGRYFIQAEKELKDTGIELYKMGLPEVPTLTNYLKSIIKKGDVIGFDGRVVNTIRGNEIQQLATDSESTIKYDIDLVNLLWDDRPDLPQGKAFLLDIKYSGETTEAKLSRLRNKMQEEDVSYHVLTTLDDIAWLYNIRGNDIPHFPVILAYSIINIDSAYLFTDRTKLSDEIIFILNKDNIKIKDYNEIYEFIKTISGKVLLDPAKLNYRLASDLPISAIKVEKASPIVLFKACKNEVELSNLRWAHAKDGVVLTKFMYWLKESVKNPSLTITELDAQQKLYELRSQQDGFIEESFSTISAYGPNAALMHYSTNPFNPAPLENKGLYLVDSGGQYFEGTTDITRTIALGELDDILKTHFTAVLQGMINLSMAKFLDGVRGINLDILARSPIWNLDIDYRSGTGHGVGYLLNVHEAPNGFRWKIVPERNDSCVLEVGMVTSNEPGIYIENSHGIRIENEIVVEKDVKNEYGQFLKFETLTYVPIDLDAIKIEMLSEKEKKWLNNYHQLTREKISKYLTDDEAKWMIKYTKAI
ncbi:MAG: peptidase M24 [Candidatus Epulonipiscioides saccharophilum]|nr:MAG: peptidase M24 [Epulopiscium sp. AS2M-Bin001]